MKRIISIMFFVLLSGFTSFGLSSSEKSVEASRYFGSGIFAAAVRCASYCNANAGSGNGELCFSACMYGAGYGSVE